VGQDGIPRKTALDSLSRLGVIAGKGLNVQLQEVGGEALAGTLSDKKRFGLPQIKRGEGARW